MTNPILLVEDSDVDVMSVKRAFRQLKIKNSLHIATDGYEGLDMLSGDSPLDPIPQIILLDLNMPKMGGIEFLLELRQHERFQNIDVVVLTTSNWYNDKIRTFDLGISAYLVKPVKQANLYATILTVNRNYWLMEKTPENT